MNFEQFMTLLIGVYLFSLGILVGYLRWAPSSHIKDGIIDGMTLAFVVRFIRGRLLHKSEINQGGIK